MSDSNPIRLSTGLPQTVLSPLPPELAAALDAAWELKADERRAALKKVAASHPTCLQAWASLAENAPDPTDAYAYARVGYHRGLDALRAAGWRGSGFVRWSEEPNRGFLRSLAALRAAAEQIGEDPEAERCELFLAQLDPAWSAGQD